MNLPLDLWRKMRYARACAAARKPKGEGETMRVWMQARWLRVRSLTDGWLTININGISHIQTVGSGFSIRMICGSLILLSHQEGNRVMRKLLDEGIKP